MATTIEKAQLVKLLKNTQRKCTINGKPINQVKGCILESKNLEYLRTTMIVRDGKTSLSQFEVRGNISDDGDESIVIPDIDMLLGVLSKHKGKITLMQDDDKLRVKSNSKTTTLAADKRAKAFPHTTETVYEWCHKSQERAKSIDIKDINVAYITADGKRIEPRATTVGLDPIVFKDAIESGNVNSQKVNRFSLYVDGGSLFLTVGQDTKGETTTYLCEIDRDLDLEPCLFEGGLENIDYGNHLKIHFINFADYGQGMSILLQFGKQFVFQRGVL